VVPPAALVMARLSVVLAAARSLGAPVEEMAELAQAVQAVPLAAPQLVLAARQHPTRARRMCPRIGQPTRLLCQTPRPRRRTRPC
jgi:hypothetical protein